jgi:ribulose-5-phosphate 4-epimerase/fuculose-1-phosphate aldolase
MKNYRHWLTLLLVLSTSIWLRSQATSAPAAEDGPDPAQVAELVIANHILATEGVLDAWGHVSVRDTRHPNHFLLARQIPPAMVTAADIVEYDFDGNPVHDPHGKSFLERYIHGEVYRSRPDVMSVIHSHAPELLPFSVTSVPLRPMIHMAGFLHGAVPVFDIREDAGDTDMLIRTSALGRAMAATLGDKPMLLLRGHGAVIVGPSLHIAVGRAVYAIVNAKAEQQALLLGGGKVTFLSPEEAAKASSQGGFERGWEYWKWKLDHP